MNLEIDDFELVVGLEVHVQLATESKIFCACRCRGQKESPVSSWIPNSQVCPVCSGQPGSLPVLNQKAVEYAVRAGLATECKIANTSVFSRKNYFYPDLPKGYQISQYDEPICTFGRLSIRNSEGQSRWITIERIHMEEDAGKSVHGVEGTQINLNRAGTPLIEVVSAPELRSPEEAGAYLRELYSIVTALGVCDGNLQEGNFRCDANVSVRPRGSQVLGTRTEIKNVNSFRFVEKAIAYEFHRQVESLLSGVKIRQETRTYDPDRDVTLVLRGKEDAQDYRYFPDPDLPPLRLTSEWIESVRKSLPELPRQKAERFQKQFALSEYDACVLTADHRLAKLFEDSIELCLSEDWKDFPLAKTATNLITQEVARRVKLEDQSSEIRMVLPLNLKDLMLCLRDKKVSMTGAKQVIAVLCERGGDVNEIIEREGLAQVSDSSVLLPVIREVLDAHPSQLAELKSGKEKVLGFLVGQIMKKTGGKANPGMIQEYIRKEILKGGE